jgi:hypothetical protein
MGEYAGVIDDDDLVDTEAMYEFIDHVAKTKPLFIQTYRDQIGRQGEFVRHLSDESDECTYEAATTGKATVTHLAIARSDLAQEAAYKALKVLDTLPKKYSPVFDVLYYLELLRMTPCVRYPKYVYKWRFYSANQLHQHVYQEMPQMIRMYAAGRC